MATYKKPIKQIKPKNTKVNKTKVKPKNTKLKKITKWFNTPLKKFALIMGLTIITLALGFTYFKFIRPALAGTACGFDVSKLSVYERSASGGTVPLSTVISPSAKSYALSIGVSNSDIRIWSKAEVEKLVREEIARQWASVPDKHGATQANAQQAILSYMIHEGGYSKFTKNSSGQYVPIHDSTTFFPLSITSDKYAGSKNKQYAAAWDIRYAVYRGVKENIDAFKNNASGSGLQRWHYTIGYVFLPSSPSRYWTDGRSSVATSAWNSYSRETAYPNVCVIDTTKPVVTVAGVNTPTRDAVQSSNSVTLRGKVTDPQNKTVRLSYKLVKYTNGWDCSSMMYAGGSANAYFPTESPGGVASGSIISYTFNNLTPGKYKYTMRARNSVPNWSSGVTLCSGEDGWLNPDANSLTFIIPSVTTTTSSPTRTPTPVTTTPSPVTTDTPTITLDSINKGSGYITIWATPIDSKGHQVQVQFRIRRNESTMTTAQKCATVKDSNYSGTVWSDLRNSGAQRGNSIAAISALTPGNYLASVRVKDAIGNISSGAKFCYENGATGADSYGWVAAQPFTIP